MNKVKWSMEELDEYIMSHQIVYEDVFERYSIKRNRNQDAALEYVQREMMKAENFKVFCGH
ncbi:MAG: hypothetical protein AVO33_04740 [delta proteobacterium ML8_F1]|nr:MAG: hypothetical protein AVO33_04740 [delta proteobacterium ML8_F1]